MVCMVQGPEGDHGAGEPAIPAGALSLHQGLPSDMSDFSDTEESEMSGQELTYSHMAPL